jgi:3-oxoadipate enol-lactonase
MPLGPGLQPSLPPARVVELPGRGTTYVHEVHGPPGAPTVVLLHGWTVTAALNWFGCFEPLGRHFNVVALDHRGHGRGIRSRRPFRLEDCADDVAALAEVLGKETIIPVGYSMGGPIAQLIWHRHPALVSGLVLAATSQRFVGNGPADRAFTSGVFGLSLAATLSPVGLRRRAAALFVGNRFDGTPRGEWMRSELRRTDPVAILQAGLALRLFDSRSWAPDIDVPSAVIVTTEDAVVSLDSQLGLARAIPGAEIYRVSGEHGVPADRPRVFAPILIAACQSVAGQADMPLPTSVARP